MKKLILITFPCLLAAKTMFVIQDTNVRSKPSLDSKIINIYKKNTPVEVLKKVYSQNGTWYQTTDGYVSNELLTKNRKQIENNQASLDEYYFSNGIYEDARKQQENRVNEITQKALFIDKKTDTVYTLISLSLLNPKELKSSINEVNISKNIEKMKNESVQEKDIKTKNKELLDTYKKWFVSATIGYSSLDAKYSNINGSFSPVGNADQNGINFGYDVGYNYNENFFTTFEYNQINVDDAKLYNYFLSANYRFNISYLKPFIGIMGGISYFKVSDSHINNLEAIDLKGRNNIYGIQTGIVLPIIDNYHFLIKYQYLKSKHTTNLIDGTTKAQWERDKYHNMQIGLRYEF